MFLRSRKLSTVPTTVFNMSVSFLYTDMKYNSAFEAFNSMTDVLVKNLELGGFETKLDENKQGCVGSTCSALANADVSSYDVSSNPYEDPSNHKGSGNDDSSGAISDAGMGLAIGMSVTMMVTLIGFFYAQYCWGYFPCFDKFIRIYVLDSAPK